MTTVLIVSEIFCCASEEQAWRINEALVTEATRIARDHDATLVGGETVVKPREERPDGKW